jgi:hypothetical protein
MEEIFFRDKEQSAKNHDKFQREFDREVKDMGLRDAVIVKLTNYYQTELQIEEKYIKSVYERLDKVQNINTLSKQQLDVMKDAIDIDIKKQRLEQLGPQSTTGPQRAPYEKIPNFENMTDIEIADRLVVSMGLAGETLYNFMAKLPKYATLADDAFSNNVIKIEEMGLRMQNVVEKTHDAREAFEKTLNEKVFSKFDGVINNTFTKITGLQGTLQGMKDKVIDSLGNKFEGVFNKLLNPAIAQTTVGLGGAAAGAAGFVAAALPIIAIVAAVAALGFVLYKAFEIWKHHKEVTIEIQKQYGLTVDRAEKLTSVSKELYLTNGAIGLTWEDSAATINALYNQFRNIKDISKELAETSTVYQKAYGFSASEAAEILKTNKVILGLSTSAMKAQDDHIVSYSNEIGFSAKEMKKLYSDASLVGKIGYENIDKMAKMASNARMSFSEIKGLSEIFELGDFEGSVKTANLLLRQGIKVDPLNMQVKLDRGDLSGVTQDLVNAVEKSGEDLTKVQGIQRKQMEMAFGSEEKFMQVLKAQASFRFARLAPEQKLHELQKMDLDTLLQQTTQLDRLSGGWATIKRVFEAIVSRFAPAIDAFMKGFEKGIRPLIEGFAKANGTSGEMFGPDAIKRIVAFGETAARVISAMVTGVEFLVGIWSGFQSAISTIWSTLKGLAHFMQAMFNAVLLPFIKVYDLFNGTNFAEDMIMKELDASAENFKQAGSNLKEAANEYAGAYDKVLGTNMQDTIGLKAGKGEKVSAVSDQTKALLDNSSKMDTLLDIIKASIAAPIVVESHLDGKKIGTGLSKRNKSG